MSILEKLAGAKALIEAAIEEEVARTAPPAERSADCKHENREEITGAGNAGKRIACVDCGETWEANDAS